MSGRRGYRDEDIPTLYVRQVHYSARPDDLRALFERMGPVRDVYIPLDYYTRESRGFAYVKFEFTRDAEDALRKLNGASVLGRRIEVEWAEGQRKSKSEMRSRDFHDYHGRGRSRRSRSPHRSGRDHSSHHRSRSRHRSRTPRRRSHSSRRRHSEDHHSKTQTKNSRDSKFSSSPSGVKSRDRSHSKSESSPGSSAQSRKRSTSERAFAADEAKVLWKGSNAETLEKQEEAVVMDELEVRSEERASDVESDEKQQMDRQQTVANNGKDDDCTYENGTAEASDEGSIKDGTGEKDNGAALPGNELVDELADQNGIILKDVVGGDSPCS